MAGLLDIIGAATGIAQLVNLFKGGRSPMDNPVLQQQLTDANTRRSYMEAALNPESPMFKNLQAMNEERSKKDAVEAINEIVKADRRARERGYTGFFLNPERRDETQAKTLATMFARAGDVAKQQAQTALFAGANTSTSPPSSAGQLFELGNAQNQIRRYSIPVAMGDVLKRGAIGLGLANEPETPADKLLKIFSGNYGASLRQTSSPSYNEGAYDSYIRRMFDPYRNPVVEEY